MSISQRQQQILDLLQKDLYLTVQHLSQLTYTSPSSIRRDLTALQKQGLVHRTHGGVSLTAPGDRVPALRQRLTKNVDLKRRIAKKAASLLKDGQSILLDGSSTAGFLLPYIAEHRQIELYTNSMETAMRALELGISTHCIGGHCVGESPVLSGEAAYLAISQLYVDILFFSSQCLDSNGIISDATQEENHLRKLMIRHARESVFLCDSGKFGSRALHTLASLSDIHTAVFDRPYKGLYATCMILD